MKLSALFLAAFIAYGTLPVFAQPAPTPSAPPVPATLTVPAGFGVSVFASGLNGARLMAVSP